MKVYDLEGCLVDTKTALIAVSLPKPAEGNAYFIKAHKIRKNAILLHLKDFIGLPLQDSTNLQPFIIDLTTTDFEEFDLTNGIDVALIHSNEVLVGNLEDIFDSIRASTRIRADNTGKGTIRP